MLVFFFFFFLHRIAITVNELHLLAQGLTRRHFFTLFFYIMTKLFGFGSNGNGQLGIGHLQDVSEPTVCQGIPDNQIVRKVIGGGNHSALLTESGRLYMAGYSQFGEEHMKVLLTQSEDENKEWMSYREISNHTWRDVACGWAYTILVSDLGKVYGMGTSKWNELAGKSSQEVIEIDPVQLQDIVSVACGWRHVIALDEHGQVYGWGWGRHGQLGPAVMTTDKKDIRGIQKIVMPQPIVQVACGHVHTLLRGKDGTVYGFGSNKYGQLGEITSDGIILNKSVFIDAGWHHSASLNYKGELKLWGRNDHGQLTNQSMDRIKNVVCGSEHTIAITDNKDVAAWGWNEHGNCTTDKDFIDTPVILKRADKVNVIGAGCATSWFG